MRVFSSGLKNLSWAAIGSSPSPWSVLCDVAIKSTGHDRHIASSPLFACQHQEMDRGVALHREFSLFSPPRLPIRPNCRTTAISLKSVGSMAIVWSRDRFWVYLTLSNATKLQRVCNAHAETSSSCGTIRSKSLLVTLSNFREVQAEFWPCRQRLSPHLMTNGDR